MGCGEAAAPSGKQGRGVRGGRPVHVLEETLRGVTVSNTSGSWRRGVCGSPAPGPAPPPRSLPVGSIPPAKHLDTSTSPLIPVWTEPPLASELEFCS
ncbi:hypothetical protein AB1E18_011514 [Capra hircus]